MKSTLADLSIVYSSPELTISFSEAPAMRLLNSGVGVIGMEPARPPENFASKLFSTLSINNTERHPNQS